ncbi:hypothetical protein BYT27DRAFT_7207509 [Phlegmacium glaucopus]|nr:hypothetical protein BYT27DRAFT_7207509 [Phlegmacium glaucopus]
MSDPEAPARNADGTLKEASEMEWLHFPSAQVATIDPQLSKKHQRANSTDDDRDSHTLPTVSGLKGKEPACRVGGKRIKQASTRAQQAKQGHLSLKTCRFFSTNFVCQKDTKNGEKSKKDGPTTLKGGKKSKKDGLAMASKPLHRGHDSEKSKTDGLVTTNGLAIASDNDDDYDDDYQGLEEGDGNGGDESGDDEEEEDPVKQYECLQAEIQLEHKPPRKHNHRGLDECT